MNSTSTVAALGPNDLSNSCILKPLRELVSVRVEKMILLFNTELMHRGEQTNSYITVKGDDGEESSDWYIYSAQIVPDFRMYDEIPHEVITKYMAAGWKSAQMTLIDNGTVVIQLFKHKSGGAKAPEPGVISILPDDSLVVVGLDQLPKLPQFDTASVALL